MIIDSMDDLNWAAIAATSIGALVIGVVWFAPVVFGQRWARQVSDYTGVPAADISAAAEQPSTLAKWLVALAATNMVLALAAQATGADTAGDGAALGVVLGLGFGATFFSWPPIFASLPWRWWLLNTAALLTMLTASGAVLGAWP